MTTPTICDIADADVEPVIALWRRCGLTRPWNDPHADIAFARASTNATVLIGRLGGAVVSSVMVGHDGHRGAVYYVAVDPDHRGLGHGRAIVVAAEDWLRARGVWKLNLSIRADNAGVAEFYRTLGYGSQTLISMAKWLDPERRPAPPGDPTDSPAASAPDPRSYPAAPLPAVSTAVFRDGKVLLARRGRPPLAGVWSLPGGLVEAGERLAEAAAREVLEETGVRAEIVGPSAAVEVIRRDGAGRVSRHFVVMSFAGRWIAGEAVPGEEASEVAWVAPGDYGGRPLTEGLEAVIEKAATLLGEP